MIIDTATREQLDFDKGGGLLPVVAQHADTGEVLMLGYANREALEHSLSSGNLHFYSRSRAVLWRKGETSGNMLALDSLHRDCDGDAVVALVRPLGPTCHTGARSCFDALPTLPRLAAVIDARAGLAAEQEGTADNSSSYTVKLLRNRNLRLKKLGEEAAELSVACADAEPRRVAEEAADLLYHSLVACRSEGVRLEDVLGILADRFASAPRLARPVSSVRPSRSS